MMYKRMTAAAWRISTGEMRKMRKTSTMVVATIAIAAAIIAGLASVAAQQPTEEKVVHAGIALVPLNVADLSKDSTHVIIGTVADIAAGPTQHDEKHSTLRAFTDVVIDVEKDIAGTYKGDQITVRTLGGMVGDVRIVAEAEAKFTEGERVVAFINDAGSNTAWGDSFVVYGREQGKYTVIDGKAYGNDHPQGIDLEEFEAQIKEFRNETGQ